MKAKLVVNPAAGKGTLRRQWPSLQAILCSEGFAFEYALTEWRGHATELARAALEAGFDLIVAVGGDGTLNEVINGMISEGRSLRPEATVGVIPVGTGADFGRSAGLPRRADAAARRLARASSTLALDVGEVTVSLDKREVSRCFVNVAGMGFDGEVMERLERGGKRGGGTIPYLSALVTTIFRYRNKDVRLQLDDSQLTGAMNSVLVCNGQFFGGGMHVGPKARLDDGQFDVIVLGDVGRLEFLANAWRVYRGTHLTHPKVHLHHSQTVVVESEQRMVVEADGELIGEGPASFRILPAALKLLV